MFPFSLHAEDKLKVVVSFSIIKDMTEQVAGGNADIESLVGPDGDVHEYEPTPTDAKKISNADIVFINNLSLEGWIERLISSSGYKKQVVVLTEGITPLTFNGHQDPHAWQDPKNGKIYVAHIRDALVAADKTHAALYEANAAAYMKNLDALDGWIKQQIALVPQEKRAVISMHDAFQYFSLTYGVKFIAPLGISTESEPSAADLSRIIDQIRNHNITAVFLENMTDSRLIKQLETDAHAHIGGTLYSDALSPPDGPAPDYISMFKHNVTALVAAMNDNPN